jgi:superfamily I DNA/RNA helicase
MMNLDLEATQEQARILTAVRSMIACDQTRQQSLKVEAGAGTGKTTILGMATKALHAYRPGVRILYLAFNKDIQTEAKEKLGRQADCYTVHGLAHRVLSINRTRRAVRPLYKSAVIRILGNHIGADDADIITRTLTGFAQSGDAWPDKRHCPKKGRNGGALSAAQREWFAERAGDLFCAVTPDQKTTENLPFDLYLKYWQLIGAPGLRDYDVVLFDEAQDASPVILAALDSAGNVIYVGDRHQSIYQFTGAVDAMSQQPGTVFPLTRSFRFGQPIADAANQILSWKYAPPVNRLTGAPTIESRIGEVDRNRAHARIFRTNRALIREAIVLADRGIGFEMAGNNQDFVRILIDTHHLQSNEAHRVKHPLVRSFDSWSALLWAVEGKDDTRDLSQAVRICEEHEDRIPEIIDFMKEGGSRTRPARVLLTTAHRAKGREFNQVVIAPDFDEVVERARNNRALWDAEMNLLYVACTRAIEALEVKSSFLGRGLATPTGLRR